ncbi:serine/threonine protein phosphatase [Paraoerskovia sediminicola]|uniref:Serine/threonine protein phosphatase n=1 Tax=Paraoerskovia sediminicola TaxID=1138587 RepID=A0ABN6XEH5_9CELL|nr:PP2C family serine/threonine-protein phosphatase [Paraoerskovia sediminicola]BDZ42092.1 serine/threonine protein phosphatase [Paraoerskovia sediminicola]
MRCAARSDVGLVRSNNQDSAFAGANLVVVADGMGGHAGGDVASALTITALAPLDHEPDDPDQALSALEVSIDAARQSLVERMQADPRLAGMGTTVTAMLRAGNRLALAHLGDSRAYLLRDGELAQVTTDHTFVQHLVDSGRITAAEAETHPQRNVVMRVLGDFDVDLTPDLSVREAVPGDRWLLCSDGLSGFVGIDEMAAILNDVPDVDACADTLLQLALRAGSTDNITAVVADVVDLDAVATGDGADGVADPTLGAPQIVGSAATVPMHDVPATQALTAGTSSDTATATEATPVDQDEADHEPDETGPTDARDAPRRRPWIPVLATLLVLAVLAGATWAAYAWTQTRYFIGESDGKVAVYQGVPSTIGPIELFSVVDVSTTEVENLPGYLQERLEQTIPETTLIDARLRMEAIASDAVVPVEPTPTATPEATPTPTATATEAAG